LFQWLYIAGNAPLSLKGSHDKVSFVTLKAVLVISETLKFMLHSLLIESNFMGKNKNVLRLITSAREPLQSESGLQIKFEID
jgi:hypothetical protein